MIYGVSLGPGEPDLITVKGLKILQKADKIYYPGSLFKSGKKASYSLSILEHYNLEASKLVGFYLEMSLARVQAQQVYETTFQQIKKDYENGLTVAVVCEGDANTFSSFSYLLEKIVAEKLNIQLIPGITSYTMAASESLQPLCLQNEKLLILPRVQSEKELEEALRNFDTVVLMKIISVMEVIENVLENKNFKVTYCERLGTEQQYIASNLEAIKNREIPYFSLIIIKK